MKWIWSDADNKRPSEIKVGDKINGMEVIKIKGLVNGKPTYASAFICRKLKGG